jgi:hypothetical protein
MQKGQIERSLSSSDTNPSHLKDPLSARGSPDDLSDDILEE